MKLNSFRKLAKEEQESSVGVIHFRVFNKLERGKISGLSN